MYRVALATPGFPPQLGGIEVVVSNLADQLAARGHQVEIFAQRRRREAFENIKPYPVHWYPDVTGTHRFPVAPSLSFDLHRRAREFDVLHVHGFHSALPLLSLPARHPRMVLTPHFHAVGHTPLAKFAHIPYDVLARRAFARAAAVTCVTSSEARLLSAKYPAVSQKVEVIPNGVEVEQIMTSSPFPVDRPVFLSAGRLEAYKRIELVIRALVTLPDAELVVCGNGPDRPRLERLAKACGVSDRTRFLGHISDADLRRWQRTAVATVTVSAHEAFGLVVLEALAAGSVAIASDIPAHRDLTAHVGRSQRLMLIQPNLAALGEAMRGAIEMEKLQEPMSGVPTWGDVAEDYSRIYRRLISYSAV